MSLDFEKVLYRLCAKKQIRNISGAYKCTVTKWFWSKTDAEEQKAKWEKNEQFSQIDLRKYISPEDR